MTSHRVRLACLSLAAGALLAALLAGCGTPASVVCDENGCDVEFRVPPVTTSETFGGAK